MKEDIKREIELADGVTAQLVGKAQLVIKGPHGEIKRAFLHPKVEIKVENGQITLKAVKGTKREKTIIGSFASHIKNMLSGVQEPHVYKVKICSGHFPMNVSVSGSELMIKNFLGEIVPRKVGIFPGVDVKVEGTEITVSGPDKEATGQTAARIENACRITNWDRRIFQDGCYIIHKAGKDIV